VKVLCCSDTGWAYSWYLGWPSDFIVAPNLSVYALCRSDTYWAFGVSPWHCRLVQLRDRHSKSAVARSWYLFMMTQSFSMEVKARRPHHKGSELDFVNQSRLCHQFSQNEVLRCSRIQKWIFINGFHWFLTVKNWAIACYLTPPGCGHISMFSLEVGEVFDVIISWIVPLP